jgi:hypothetical protein
MKKNKKLALNKQIMANLSEMNEIRGGVSATIGPDCNAIATLVLCNFTKGNCDIHTIGHDDGSHCISKEWNWCHGIE